MSRHRLIRQTPSSTPRLPRCRQSRGRSSRCYRSSSSASYKALNPRASHLETPHSSSSKQRSLWLSTSGSCLNFPIFFGGGRSVVSLSLSLLLSLFLNCFLGRLSICDTIDVESAKHIFWELGQAVFVRPPLFELCAGWERDEKKPQERCEACLYWKGYM